MAKQSLTTLEEIKSRREEIYSIAAKYGISDIRVFGSVARGDDNKNSDVDFLIKSANWVSLFEVCDFKYEVEDLLHKRTDIVSEDGVSKFLKDRIFSEAVSI
jgi:predicted nucleotidyltransferase